MEKELIRIRRALLTVADKTGLAEFARGLREHGAELISTGKTAEHLRGAGMTVTDVAEVTGLSEMLDGRVKTLHPAIHGAILARRSDPEHERQLTEHRISPIDLVAVNLYPFETTIAEQPLDFSRALEHIDIGGGAPPPPPAPKHQHPASPPPPPPHPP